MPASFGDVASEIRAVRERTGIVDLSHRGRLFVSGTGAEPLLRETLTFDPSLIEPLHGSRSLLCDESGGILDLVSLYRQSSERWLIAGSPERADLDLRWLNAHRRSGVEVRIDDRRQSTVMLALQGAGARHVFSAVFSAELEQLIPAGGCYEIELHRTKALVSRGGDTGEDGFEFVCGVDAGLALWEHFTQAGVTPCGLEAHEVLRIEAGVPRYGAELDGSTSPWEADLSALVTLEPERAFEGRAALERLRGFDERRLVRLRGGGTDALEAGRALFAGDTQAGRLTSAAYSPTLGRWIAFGFLAAALERTGPTLAAESAAGGRVPVEVVQQPFLEPKASA